MVKKAFRLPVLTGMTNVPGIGDDKPGEPKNCCDDWNFVDNLGFWSST